MMGEHSLSDIETASASVVLQAARDFAEALSETPQFQAFEQAAHAFRKDTAAQQAIKTYQEKERSLRGLKMLNALSPEQTDELEQLQNAFNSMPVVQEYAKAQSELITLCQVLGDGLSEATGLNYAAACSSGCCG